MKKIIIPILSLFIFLACAPDKAIINLTNGIYISDVTIITTEDGNYNPYKGYVIVERDKIVYVGKQPPTVKGDIKNIDGQGKYLIPGLIDNHVHLTEVQGMDYRHQEKYPELVEEFNIQLPRSYLYFGYTTLINLGGISQAHEAFINAQPLGPDLYHTGRSGAAVANGYPMNFVPEEFRFDATPNFIYLESQAQNIPDRFDPANHTAEAVVERIKASGAIAVKSYVETGFGRFSNLPVPTRAIMESLKKNAHNNDLLLTVHGNNLQAHAFLSDIGVDVIAHGLWNWEDYRDVPNDSLPAAIKDVLNSHIEKQIGYTATLSVIEGEKVLVDPDFLGIPQLKHVVSQRMMDWYKTDEGQWFARDIFGDLSPEQVNAIYGKIQAHGQLALKYLSDNDGLILFGTDTPSAPTYGNQPGYNGYWEMQLMQEAGVPLDKILSSATINNAKVYHLDSLIGSISTGKQANLILMTKNPLEDIEAYDNIEMVLKGGQVIMRKELSLQNKESKD